MTNEKRIACTADYHTALKLDATVWASLPRLPDQIIPAWMDEPEERIELRNCPCGSTLAVQS